MDNQLAVTRPYSEIEKIAQAMVGSGFFQDSKQANQAIVKILAGQELGFGAFASMTGVYIISGRPSFGANIIAAAVKKSGRYNYRVIELSDAACEIEYYESGKPAGRSRFTIEDARKAGTKNLDRFPRNMLFARAMSNGARWYCPDVFNGSPVYTPEELGANVDEEGNVIDAPAVGVTVITDHPTNGNGKPAVVEAAQAMDAVVTQTTTLMGLEMAEAVTNSEGIRYGEIDSEKLSHMSASIIKALKTAAPEKREAYELKRDAIATILAARAARAAAPEPQDDPTDDPAWVTAE